MTHKSTRSTKYRRLERALVKFYNGANRKLFAKAHWIPLPEAETQPRQYVDTVVFLFEADGRHTMRVVASYREETIATRKVFFPVYAIGVNTKTKEFANWQKDLSGFEKTVIHEMIHIWLHQHYSQFAGYSSLDPFEYYGTTWNDYYLEALLLLAEFLRKKDAVFRTPLWDAVVVHKVEFFVMCYILSKQIMDDQDFFGRIAPDIAGRYSKRGWALKALTRRLYSYI